MERRLVLAVAVLVSGAFLVSSAAVAQQSLPAGSLVIKVLAEKKVAALPAGKPRLYWRLENFPSLAQAQARLSVPGFIETSSEPLIVPPTGEEQRVIVKMPGGFEYKEIEVAQTASLKSTGAIKFDWKNTKFAGGHRAHRQGARCLSARCRAATARTVDDPSRAARRTLLAVSGGA